MKRFCAVMAFWIVAIASFSAWSQTSGPTGFESNSNSNSNGGPGVLGDSPSAWVNRALARHNALIAQRVTGPLQGRIPTTQPSQAGSGSSGLLSGLGNLLSQLGGGSSGLGNLASLLGGLGGSGSSGGSTDTGSGTGSTGGTDSSGTGSTGTGGTGTGSTGTGGQTSGFTLADLLRLRDTGSTSSPKNSTEQVVQQAENPPHNFHSRWVTALSDTFFTALTTAFLTPAFEQVLENAMRQAVGLPPLNTNVNANTNTNANSNANVNANTNSSSNANTNRNFNTNVNANRNRNANSNGDGIEDIPPPGGNSNDNGGV